MWPEAAVRHPSINGELPQNLPFAAVRPNVGFRPEVAVRQNNSKKMYELALRRGELHPPDGLLTTLIFAEQGGDTLSSPELLAMIFLLFTAGHETMVSFCDMRYIKAKERAKRV